MSRIWPAVSRVLAHSDFFGMDMVLDINSDIYPVKVRSAPWPACELRTKYVFIRGHELDP